MHNFLKKPGTMLDPFDPRNFAKKCVLKLVKQFSSHCLAIKSVNIPQSCLQVIHFVAF